MRQGKHPSPVLPRELEESPAFLKALLEESPAGILVIDRGYAIRYVNPAALQWIQRPASEVQGRRCYEVLLGTRQPCRAGPNPCPAATALRTSRPAGPVTIPAQDREGGQRHILVRSCPAPDQEGTVRYAVEFFVDITAEVLRRDYGEETAMRDPLTGLYNRQGFHHLLERELKRTRRQSHPLSLCLIDADSFKDYNEREGNKAGDALLERLARILLQQTRSGVDSASRLQADTFGLILPEATREQALEIARRIHNASQEARLPVSLSIATCAAQEHEGPDGLFRRASDLLFQAKRSGGNQIV